MSECTHVSDPVKHRYGYVCFSCWRKGVKSPLRFTPEANREMFRAMVAMNRQWPGRG